MWIDQYPTRRYGRSIAAIREAWIILHSTVYNCTDGSFVSCIIFLKFRLEVVHTVSVVIFLLRTKYLSLLFVINTDRPNKELA